MTPTFLTTLELADRWRVSPRTIEHWRAIGRAPQAVRLGRRVLYRLTDIEALEIQEYNRLLQRAHVVTAARSGQGRGQA